MASKTAAAMSTRKADMKGTETQDLSERGDPFSFLNFDLKVKPPISTNSVKRFDPRTIAEDAKGTHIVVHECFPQLVEAFLEHKRKHGSKYERELYGEGPKNFSWQDEVARLIEKRPLVFMGRADYTVLRDGEHIKSSPTEEWDRNGTDQQHLNGSLTLEDYLSYDEIMLGSLVGVSGPSHFVNDGNRYNCGRPGTSDTFETPGVIIGVVGARFERTDRMDSVHILPPAAKPHQHPELTKLFHGFFGVQKDAHAKFDTKMYQARMRITIDVFLLEANSRAQDAGKTAYAYVVGLGLGVWQHCQEQPEYYVDAFASALDELKLPYISTLEFAWIGVGEACQKRVTEAAREQGIKVRFSRRNPAERLDTDELLVLSYAWDGNAFPGNEYWTGSLSGSGDPAAACMSTIGELHNPLVNPKFLKRVKVLTSEN